MDSEPGSSLSESLASKPTNRVRPPRTTYTQGYVPTFDYHTREYTIGLNWYPNYWVKYQFNLAIDQLKDPSLIGAVPQNYFVALQRLQFRF